MQPLGHESADSCLKNHPQLVQASDSCRPSLAAQLWPFLQPVTQNQDSRLLGEGALGTGEKGTDLCCGH